MTCQIGSCVPYHALPIPGGDSCAKSMQMRMIVYLSHVITSRNHSEGQRSCILTRRLSRPHHEKAARIFPFCRIPWALFFQVRSKTRPPLNHPASFWGCWQKSSTQWKLQKSMVDVHRDASAPCRDHDWAKGCSICTFSRLLRRDTNSSTPHNDDKYDSHHQHSDLDDYD